MKKDILTVIILFTSFIGTAQTVVRMRMPAQSENALSVATLYNEALPTGISIVLGVIGYEITGGTAPYQYEWLKDNQVFATGEIAVINPEKNVNYVLRIKDKNFCIVENSINISASSKVAKNYLSETVKINIKSYSNELDIQFNGFVPQNTMLNIFDTQGKLQVHQNINENLMLALNLPKGIYIVVVGNGEMYCAQKIMLK